MDIHTEQPLLPASLLRRLMAMIYDAFLLMGISFAYGVIVLLLRILIGEDTMQPPGNVLQVIIVLGLWFFYALFYVWCWRRTGQTLGMKSWRLQLQSRSQLQPTWKECWLRCIFAPFSLAILGIGYLWCIFDKNGDCLHDIYSNTKVVLLPKDK
ncbi:MAG: RDD family protein [Porticoccus sp.]|nr:RDD family protein [Porticoccus sp.]